MEPVVLFSVALALLVFGSISRRAERSVLTPPLWFVLVGFGSHAFGDGGDIVGDAIAE